MRDNVLWRKIARIILMIAERLQIDEEQALDLFYKSKTYTMLKDPKYGLQIMSDAYVADEYFIEIGQPYQQFEDNSAIASDSEVTYKKTSTPQ